MFSHHHTAQPSSEFGGYEDRIWKPISSYKQERKKERKKERKSFGRFEDVKVK